MPRKSPNVDDGAIVEIGKDPAQRVPFGARVSSLDGIRGVAILSVLAFHTLRIPDIGGVGAGAWRAVQESTWCGVDLFFVLSGFLITGILLDSKAREGYFKNFYIRRALRIMPLYYAVLVTVLVIIPAIRGISGLPGFYSQLLSHQLWLWTYTQNYFQAKGEHMLPGFGHFWSLAIEEQFYWLWPLAVYFLTRRALFNFCVGICVVEPLVRFMLLHSGLTPWAIRQYTFSRVDSLLFGAIAALLLRDKSLLMARRYIVPTAVFVAGAVVAAIGFHYGWLPFEAPETVVAGYSAVALLFATLVYFSASGAQSLSSVFTTGCLRWFGKYSYGIYIFHPLLRDYFGNLFVRQARTSPFISAIACCALTTAASSAIAWLSWTLFESKFLKLKRYFEYGTKPSSLSVSGAVESVVTLAPERES